MSHERRKTRQVVVGWVPVGGDAPVTVQSMTTTKTADVEGTLAQIYALADHPRLEAAWQQYLPTFVSLLEVTINHDDDLHESAADHDRLYAVMRSGNLEAAAGVLEAHLDGARDRMTLELAARREEA